MYARLEHLKLKSRAINGALYSIRIYPQQLFVDFNCMVVRQSHAMGVTVQQTITQGMPFGKGFSSTVNSVAGLHRLIMS